VESVKSREKIMGKGHDARKVVKKKPQKTKKEKRLNKKEKKAEKSVQRA
jgi:hypothetical protein